MKLHAPDLVRLPVQRRAVRVGSHRRGVGVVMAARCAGGGIRLAQAAKRQQPRGEAVTSVDREPNGKYAEHAADDGEPRPPGGELQDRKSTRLNSSHLVISYAVFCLKKK